MIIQRMNWRIKNGMLGEAVNLLREEDNAVLSVIKHNRPPARIYRSLFGPVSRVVMEWTYTSFDEKAADNEAWASTGRIPAFLDKWAKINDKLISSEIYELHSTHTIEDSINSIEVRWIWDTAQNRHEELVDLFTEWVVNTGKYTARVMTKMYGTLSGVIMEVEYADLTDYQTQMHEWLTQPEIESFWEKFNEVSLPEGSTEVWNLEP